MMPSHQSLQAPVGVFVLTAAGWVKGILHLSTFETLLEFLNAQGEILKLTEVLLPGTLEVRPFLALNRSAALLIVPLVDPDVRPGNLGIPSQGHLPVTCLLHEGLVLGHLKRPRGMRISDFLLKGRGFIEMLQCRMGPVPPLEPVDRIWPKILVNARSILGVAESEP